jgi:hypothetical protein
LREPWLLRATPCTNRWQLTACRTVVHNQAEPGPLLEPPADNPLRGVLGNVAAGTALAASMNCRAVGLRAARPTTATLVAGRRQTTSMGLFGLGGPELLVIGVRYSPLPTHEECVSESVGLP